MQAVHSLNLSREKGYPEGYFSYFFLGFHIIAETVPQTHHNFLPYIILIIIHESSLTWPLYMKVEFSLSTP